MVSQQPTPLQGFGDIAETYIKVYFTRPRSSIYPIRNICTGGRLDCESKDKRQRQVPHTLWIVLTSTLELYVNVHPPSPSKPLGTPQWPTRVGSPTLQSAAKVHSCRFCFRTVHFDSAHPRRWQPLFLPRRLWQRPMFGVGWVGTVLGSP